MIKGLEPGLEQWSKHDIESHAKYVAMTVLEDIKDDVK